LHSDGEESFSSANDEFHPKSPPFSFANTGNSGSKKDGARKRKLTNPVRLPSVPDDSNDDFCCYDDGTEVSPHEDDEDDNPNQEKIFRSSFSSPGEEERGKDEICSNPGENEKDIPKSLVVVKTEVDLNMRDGSKYKVQDKDNNGPVENGEDTPTSLVVMKAEVNHNMSYGHEKEDNMCEKRSKRVASSDGEKSENDRLVCSNDQKEVDGSDEKNENHLGRLESLPIFNSESPKHSESSFTPKSDDEEDCGEGADSPNSSK